MPIDSTPTTPTTLLDAVNVLLHGIHVQPISSLVNVNLDDDAAGAKKALDDVTRECLMAGYEFNTERDVSLLPDLGGEIALPLNCLKVTSARFQSGNRLVPRGQRLYDPKKRTYVISATAKVDMVIALPFEEMTQAARTYVTGVAARRFCIPKLPTGATFRYTEEMVLGALAIVQQEDADMLDADLTSTSPHFAKMRRG